MHIVNIVEDTGMLLWIRYIVVCWPFHQLLLSTKHTQLHTYTHPYPYVLRILTKCAHSVLMSLHNNNRTWVHLTKKK